MIKMKGTDDIRALNCEESASPTISVRKELIPKIPAYESLTN